MTADRTDTPTQESTTPAEHRQAEAAHDAALDEARQRIRGERHDEATNEVRRREGGEAGPEQQEA